MTAVARSSRDSRQESSAKLTNQRISYAFTSSPFSFNARHIDYFQVSVIDSVPSIGVYYFLSLTRSVCNAPSLKNRFFFFVSRWNRAISWPSVLHDKSYKTLFFEFLFVAMATKFGLFLQKFQITSSLLFSDGIELFFER